MCYVFSSSRKLATGCSHSMTMFSFKQLFTFSVQFRTAVHCSVFTFSVQFRTAVHCSVFRPGQIYPPFNVQHSLPTFQPWAAVHGSRSVFSGASRRPPGSGGHCDQSDYRPVTRRLSSPRTAAVKQTKIWWWCGPAAGGGATPGLPCPRQSYRPALAKSLVVHGSRLEFSHVRSKKKTELHGLCWKSRFQIHDSRHVCH